MKQNENHICNAADAVFYTYSSRISKNEVYIYGISIRGKDLL